MKKLLTSLTLLFILVALGAKAQIPQGDFGPVNIFVSEQGGNPVPLYNGGYQASADEGREVHVNINNVQGPIIIAPMNFDLVGPECPTYVGGHRVPANVVPPNTANFNGNVSLDVANIPAAGTTVLAQFSGTDGGFWTRCATGVQVPENVTRTARFNIVSIKMTLVEANVDLCKEDPAIVHVNALYPAAAGAVTWASRNGKFTVVGNNIQATLNGTADGNDFLDATFTVGQAVYKKSIPVAVKFVKFTNPRKIYAWFNGGQKDAKLLLTAGSNRANLAWTLTLNGGAGTATIDNATGMINFPQAAGGTYTLTAAFRAAPACKATCTVIFMGYDVLVNNSKNANTCDGTQNIPIKVVPIPNTVPVAELQQFVGLTLTSETVGVDNGNEEGTSVLGIGALDANFQTKIDKAIWFSTVNCNFSSKHLIRATATVDGNAVNTPLPGKTEAKLTTSISCINGRAYVIKAFKGSPTVAIGRSPLIRNAYRAVISGAGSFDRDVKGTAEWWGPANSQFMPFVRNEENFHKDNQLENPNHVMMTDLYDPNRVMALAGTLWWDSYNPYYARAMVLSYFVALCNAEFMRSGSFFSYPSPRRCFIENEAKQNTGIQFGFHFHCAYPLCGG
jgi:hypothetical protein